MTTDDNIDVNALREKLFERGRELIWSGTTWIDIVQFVDEYQRWTDERRIFAIENNGITWIPAYALDDHGQPLTIIHDVMNVLNDRSGFQLAGWFESPNTYLDAHRPRELLRSEPQNVLRAAVYHKDGACHG